MKLLFIIAHKYIRGYPSFLNYYVSNINILYPGSTILIVDNNSIHKEDVLYQLRSQQNVICIDNNRKGKFEIGAYTAGLQYLFDNNLDSSYNFVIFTQDNFIAKNRFDFEELAKGGILACPINSHRPDGGFSEIVGPVLDRIGLHNRMNEITFCWCSSFIVAGIKLGQLYEYFKSIVISTRRESEAGERYLARILYELNNHQNYDIDGEIMNLGYDCWSVNLLESVPSYFAKRVQQKTEKTKDLDSCVIAYNENHDLVIRDYYLYIVDLFTNVANLISLNYNMLFGNYDYAFNNNFPVLKIDIQYEHTLVKVGGRNSEDASKGVIPVSGTSDNYLVRIQNFDYLKNLDIVVEYSRPNIKNIRSSGLYNSFLDKVVYLSPLIYEPEVPKYREDKMYSSLTLFGDTSQPRRRSFLDMLEASKVPTININNCFGKDALKQLYNNTKILINIHQTDHHDTLEELRILPALLNGVIVICEDSPLTKEVPYSEFLIFSSLESMPDKIFYILENYNEIWSSIFHSDRFIKVINQLKLDNERVVVDFLSKLRI